MAPSSPSQADENAIDIDGNGKQDNQEPAIQPSAGPKSRNKRIIAKKAIPTIPKGVPIKPKPFKLPPGFQTGQSSSKDLENKQFNSSPNSSLLGKRPTTSPLDHNDTKKPRSDELASEPPKTATNTASTTSTSRTGQLNQINAKEPRGDKSALEPPKTAAPTPAVPTAEGILNTGFGPSQVKQSTTGATQGSLSGMPTVGLTAEQKKQGRKKLAEPKLKRKKFDEQKLAEQMSSEQRLAADVPRRRGFIDQDSSDGELQLPSISSKILTRGSAAAAAAAAAARAPNLSQPNIGKVPDKAATHAQTPMTLSSRYQASMELLKSINMKLNASARTQATIFNVAEETRGLAEEARSLADEARGLAEETRALAEKTRARAEETRAHADAFKEEFGTIGAKLMEVSDLMKATHRIAQEHSGREETDGSEDDYESPSGSSGFSGEEGDE